MDSAYMHYCFADPDFYDLVERRDDARSRFAVAGRSAPQGWSRYERGVWVVLRPPAVSLPPQGWKIHISACLRDAEDVLGIVWDYCAEQDISFKFLRSRDILLIGNSKYANRASSGKLLTLYPRGDAQLHTALTDLSAALEAYRGPYILSDLRWGRGPVYVRYGGVMERYCPSAEGDLVPAIAAPDGSLIPDVRRPAFTVPPWVEVPDFLAAQIAERTANAPVSFPYEIDRALHFSNGGGVYQARDTRTGAKVVLKEARPFAGFEREGTDAVARLERERIILEQLSDLEFTPAVIDYLTYWEHDFLVEEYLEGEPLTSGLVTRYPLLHPDPSGSELAGYTAWALDVLGQVERALAQLHRRGIVFGDLHPGNVLLRPDGRIALVDFEEAFPVSQNRRPGLGAPGFIAPASCTGHDIDEYALACLRLWMFLPLTGVLDRDPTKIDTFVGVLTERFRVPETFAAQVRRSLGAAPRVAVRRDREYPDWDALRKSMMEAILASATPQRPDRLFPGDVAQFRYGGFTLAYGAAGVLYALHTTGMGTLPEHVDWLVRTASRVTDPHAGLFTGLHGLAYVLDELGCRDEALSTLERALALIPDVRAMGLFGGLAGIGLTLLHFARGSADPSLREGAIRIAERLSAVVGDPDVGQDRPSAAGLMYGFSGPALFFAHLYVATTEATFLDLAASALRRDLAYCQTTEDGRLQVREGHRLLPYLATGSAGIGLVLTEYLHHRNDEELATVHTRLRRACCAEFVAQSGLFHGRAGLIAYLSRTVESTQRASEDAALQRHLHRLSWHAVPYLNHLGFLGDQLLRLSMDLATGSAGILLALHTAHDPTATVLPFLPHRPFRTPVRTV
jgi:serine/threonine protein kinase